MSTKVSTKDLHLAAEPRVQLLPPMVKQRELVQRTRRMAVFALFVSVVLALGGTAFGYLRAMQAQGALAGAHELTAQIQSQQSQYAEAAQTARLIADTESAQRVVTSNEIQWQLLVARLVGYLPPGYVIAEIGLAAPAPWEGVVAPEGELRATGIGTLSVVISGPDYAGAAAFVTAVYSMPGVADAYITKTEFKDGGYRTTISIVLDEEVRSDRFEPEPESPETDEGETTDSEGESEGEVAP